MNFNFKIPILFILSAVVLNESVFAQKSISSKDTSAIKQDALFKMKTFFAAFNNIVSEEDPETRKQEILNNIQGNQRIFNNTTKKPAVIEPDYDTAQKCNECIAEPITNYFDNLNINYIQKPEPKFATDFNIIEISCVKHDADNNYYLSVRYEQQFKGKFKDNEKYKYQKVLREANLLAIKDGYVWKTYITYIGYYDYTKNNDAVNCAPINDENNNVIEEKENVLIDEKYNEYLINRAKKQIENSQYCDAYLSLQQAGNSKKFIKIIDQLNIDLDNKIRQSSAVGREDYLCKKLQIKATQNYEQQYKYEEELYCLQRAMSLNPQSSNIQSNINAIQEKINRINNIKDLYNKHSYDAAKNNFLDEIKNDPDNPYLYAWVGNCYEKLHDTLNAEKNFKTALSKGNDNADIHAAYGFYLEEKNLYLVPYAINKKFEPAAAEFALGISLREDKDDPKLMNFYSELSFCKGLSAYFKKNYTEALDSFNSAQKTNDSNYKAILYKAKCLHDLKNDAEAFNTYKLAEKIGPSYAGTHYEFGNFLLHYVGSGTNVTEDHRNEAIDEYKKATDLDQNDKTWFYELGHALLDLAKSRYYEKKEDPNRGDFFNEPKSYFEKSLAIDPNYKTCYLELGECYFYKTNYTEAENNYNVYIQKSGSKNKDYYRDMGDLCLAQGKYAEAEEQYKLAPNDANCLYGWGEAKCLNGESDYMQYFTQAFNAGIDPKKVESDPHLDRLTENKEFRNLRKQHK